MTLTLLPEELGKSKAKPKFSQVFSNNAAINWLSAARFFLFGARDVWFVVAVPVFMSGILGWSYVQVGTFMAAWVIGYGIVQASAPVLLGLKQHAPGAGAAHFWALVLLLIPAGIALALAQGWDAGTVLVSGLLVFGVVFALNSALHSYLILAYAYHDKVALKVGFYYMANAGGRLAGTVLSGWSYQYYGLEGCLWFSAGFVLVALLLSLPLNKASRALT